MRFVIKGIEEANFGVRLPCPVQMHDGEETKPMCSGKALYAVCQLSQLD